MKTDPAPFISCDCAYEHAGIVLFGAPFDGTASYRKGARLGPQEMRNAGDDGIETYSPYQDMDLEDIRVCDIGDLSLPPDDAFAALAIIEQTAARIAKDGKRPVMLGGEHLVTLGVVRALAAVHDDLHVIHLDAHADVRDDYLGEKLSHATVMRRVWDILGDGRIFQYGIRSGDREELRWAGGRMHTHMFDVQGIEYALAQTAGHPVYLTVDLDVLDSSVLPGTGTPEAGGISFNDLIGAFAALSGANVVGADLTELSPPCDPGGASTAAACKALRELLLAIS